LDEVGLLDETFFMYGEDIDLSYRIQLGGYKNYYFPETSIIHYKGESTKKGSVNYVFVFYRAMIIFAKKHFAGNQAKFLSLLINVAIYLRAALSITKRIASKLSLVIIDFTSNILGLYAILMAMEKLQNHQFDRELVFIMLPLYSCFYIILSWVAGQYDRPNSFKSNIRTTILAFVGMFFLYSLMPKEIRFSRLFLLFASTFMVSFSIISRILFTKANLFSFTKTSVKNFGIIGEEDEINRTLKLLSGNTSENNKYTLDPNNINKIDDFININKINVLVLCAKNLKSSEIIKIMGFKFNQEIEFKIAQAETDYLIGSNSIHTQGELYLSEINKYAAKDNQRIVRLLELFISISHLVLIILIIPFYKNKKQLMVNLTQLFIGNIRLLSLVTNTDLSVYNKGIIPLFQDANPEINEKKKIIFLRDFTIYKWLEIFFSNWKKLDNN
jgi:O-antigen biosynthesis protein